MDIGNRVRMRDYPDAKGILVARGEDVARPGKLIVEWDAGTRIPTPHFHSGKLDLGGTQWEVQPDQLELDSQPSEQG